MYSVQTFVAVVVQTVFVVQIGTWGPFHSSSTSSFLECIVVVVVVVDLFVCYQNHS